VHWFGHSTGTVLTDRQTELVKKKNNKNQWTGPKNIRRNNKNWASKWRRAVANSALPSVQKTARDVCTSRHLPWRRTPPSFLQEVQKICAVFPDTKKSRSKPLFRTGNILRQRILVPKVRASFHVRHSCLLKDIIQGTLAWKEKRASTWLNNSIKWTEMVRERAEH